MSTRTQAVEANTGIITLNHASKRNALGRELIEELIAAFDEMKSAAIRSVILRAQPGATVWSAGHDVAELPTSGGTPRLRRPAPPRRASHRDAPAGHCDDRRKRLGRGLRAGDHLRHGDRRAQRAFALTPARLGVPYNTAGILNMMNAIGMPLLKEMLFTARPIPAERALHLGMINEIVPGRTSNARPWSSPP